MNKKAFTLAEVLITLTIIGVIAALTIPNLMQSYKKHIYVTQLKNWYSDFSNTFNEFNYQAESGWSYNNTAGQYFWTQQNPNFENQVFIKVLDEKYGKTNANKTKQHWQKNYKSLDGSSDSRNTPYSIHFWDRARTYILKSGTIMGIYYEYYSATNQNWIIVIDVNGSNKGPNVVGRDTFHFTIKNEKLFPRTGKCNPSIPNGSNNDIINGVGCANKILIDGWQMNY